MEQHDCIIIGSGPAGYTSLATLKVPTVMR
jgi:thioredoxin reductase